MRILPLVLAAAVAGVLAASPSRADEAKDLIQALSNAPGPSGFEEPVRTLMVEHMRPLADHIAYDGLGSVVASQGSRGPRVMIDAHMDELGGLVRRVRPDGFVTMQMLGGWMDQALAGQRWVILGSKGPVEAVSGIRDVHLASEEERARLEPHQALFLDIGASDAAEAAVLGVSPGDPVAPESAFSVLAGGKDYVGKAFDDRIGCAVLVEAMRRLKARGHPNQLFFAATVQEEIGMRGAQTSSALVRPDIGVSIEGGVTGDTPDAHPDDSEAVLGGGPVAFLYDHTALPNRKLLAFVRETAQRAGVPLQTDLLPQYGEDSAEIQRSGTGVPTINLAVPVRYTHAHNGVVSRADFDRTVDLVVALVEGLDASRVADLRRFSPEP